MRGAIRKHLLPGRVQARTFRAIVGLAWKSTVMHGHLYEAPAFEHPIVSVTGRMVLMRTVDPEIFVRCKRWLANQAPDRDLHKRSRDLSQAEIVHVLLEEGRLQSKIR